jgi:hypothetical protein
VHLGRHFGDDADVPRPELVKALDLSYVADSYRCAVAVSGASTARATSSSGCGGSATST